MQDKTESPKTPSQSPSSLLEQYDLLDSSDVSSVGVESATPTPPASTLRDPATGKFVSAKSAPPKHPDRLVRRAKDLGFGAEEIDELSTERLYQEVQLATQERQDQRYSESISRAMEPQGDGAAGNDASPPVAPEPFDIGLDESQYDPGIIGALKKQAEIIKSLQATVAGLEGHARAQHGETVAQRFDGAFAALGESFHGLLGKGSLADLDPKGIEVKRRKTIIKEAAELAGTNTDIGKILRKFDEAARTFFGVPPKAQVTPEPEKPRQPTPDQDDWLSAGLARTTHRSGSEEPKGREKAIRGVEEFRRQNGFAAEPNIKDEFPG